MCVTSLMNVPLKDIKNCQSNDIPILRLNEANRVERFIQTIFSCNDVLFGVFTQIFSLRNTNTVWYCSIHTDAFNGFEHTAFQKKNFLIEKNRVETEHTSLSMALNFNTNRKPFFWLHCQQRFQQNTEDLCRSLCFCQLLEFYFVLLRFESRMERRRSN